MTHWHAALDCGHGAVTHERVDHAWCETCADLSAVLAAARCEQTGAVA